MDSTTLDNETQAKVEELRTLVDATISEFREWEHVAGQIARTLDDVSGALDAEDFKGAVEDALSNMRLIDWSTPKRMQDLLDERDGDLLTIENALDEIKGELDDDEEDEDEEEDQFSPESYLRGAIDALNARNTDDAISHIAKALERITTS